MRNESRTFQAALLAVSNISRQAMTLVVSVFLARALTVQDFGVFQQYNLIFGLIISTATLGIHQSVLVNLPNHRNRERDVWISNQLSLILLGLASFLLLLIFRDLVAESVQSPSLGSAMPVIAFTIAVTLPTQAVVPALIAKGKYYLVMGYTLVSRGSWLIFVIAATVVGHNDIHSILGAIALVSLLTLVASSLLVPSVVRSSVKLVDRDFVRADWSIGLPLGLSTLLGAVAVRLDNLLVTARFDSAYYAVFSIGAMDIPLIGYISTSTYSVLVPILSRLHEQDQRAEMLELWHSAIAKSASLLIPAMGFLLLFSREFVVLLYSERYSSASVILSLYLLAIPARVISYSTLPTACRDTRFIFRVEAVATVAHLVLGLLLFNLVGPYGVVWAMLISLYGVILGGYLPWFRRYFHCRTSALYPVKQLAWIALATLLGALAAGTLKALAPGLGTLVLMTTGGLIYGVVTMGIVKLATGIDWVTILVSFPRRILLTRG